MTIAKIENFKERISPQLSLITDAHIERRIVSDNPAGVTEHSLGIESGDQRILNAMNKSAKLERYRYGIKRLNELDIVTFGAFIVGFPSETEESVRNTLEFIQSTQPTFFTPQIYYHDVRSPVHRQAREFGLTNSGYSWTHNGMDWKTASSWVLQMIRDLPDSTPIPLYSMSLWGILYLVERGKRLR